MKTIGLIWAAVFASILVLAVVLTTVYGGAQTGESAAVGALAGIVGIGLTFVYVVVSLLLHPRRRHPSWWVVGALGLGGMVAGISAAALGASGSLVTPAVWVLIGAYVVGSLVLRRD